MDTSNNFSSIINKAYKEKWSFINSFRAEFHINNSTKLGKFWSKSDDENINMFIVSFSTPQFTNQNIENFYGNQWHIHNGRDELYKFSITFRDSDQMKLYRKFVRMYIETKHHYFDDVKFDMVIYKANDYADGNGEMKLLDLKEILIDSVSQLDFNNTTEAQIAEFTIEFKARTVESPYNG